MASRHVMTREDRDVPSCAATWIGVVPGRAEVPRSTERMSPIPSSGVGRAPFRPTDARRQALPCASIQSVTSGANASDHVGPCLPPTIVQRPTSVPWEQDQLLVTVSGPASVES